MAIPDPSIKINPRWQKAVFELRLVVGDVDHNKTIDQHETINDPWPQRFESAEDYTEWVKAGMTFEASCKWAVPRFLTKQADGSWVEAH